jgi:predicted GNAT family acetyltransferase
MKDARAFGNRRSFFFGEKTMAENTELDTPLIGGNSPAQPLNGATETPPAQTDPPAEPKVGAEADAPAKAAEEEVDYKAKFEAAEAQIAKLGLDRKAEQVGRQRTAERDAKMDEILDGQKAVQDSNAALIKALNSGENEGLPAELEEINQNSRSRTSLSRIRVQAQGLLEALTDIGKDEDGNTVVDIQRDERFSAVRDDWNRISGDAALEPSEKLAQLSRVVTQANLTMRGIDRDLAKKAIEEAKNAGEVGRKKALEETGLLDTDAGGRTGPAEGSVAPLLQKYNTGARVTQAEEKRVAEYLDTQLDEAPGSALVSA